MSALINTTSERITLNVDSWKVGCFDCFRLRSAHWAFLRPFWGLATLFLASLGFTVFPLALPLQFLSWNREIFITGANHPGEQKARPQKVFLRAQLATYSKEITQIRLIENQHAVKELPFETIFRSLVQHKNKENNTVVRSKWTEVGWWRSQSTFR